MTNIMLLKDGVQTSEVFESKFTCHPITDYDGDDLSYFFDVVREDYINAGIEIISMSTYYNSGYNHITGAKEKPEEFGIEVEHA